MGKNTKPQLIEDVWWGKNIWRTPNGHKLARAPSPGSFTKAQAEAYDLKHPLDKKRA